MLFYTLSQATASQATAQASGSEEAIAVAVVIAITMLVLLVAIAIQVVICAMLYKIQSALPDQYQKLPPMHVWLLMIPIFNLFWNFMVYPKIADSYKAYFDERGDQAVGDCGKMFGMVYSIGIVCSMIPMLGCVASLIALITLILFFVKLFELKRRVEEQNDFTPHVA